MVDAGTSSVFATLGFGVVVFAIIFVAFEIFRRKFLDVYIPNVRKGAIKSEKVQAPSPVVGSWILQIWKVSDDEIITIAGMDAYVYLRFLKMCFRIALICSFLGSTLLAVYGTSDTDDDTAAVHGISLYSMANIPAGDQRLWAPCLFTYLYTFIFLYYAYFEYANFTIKRGKYLKSGDPFVPRQTLYSILVENIPSKYRTSQGLYNLFDRLFPGEVLYAYVAISLAPLETLVMYREQLLAELEKHIAVYEASGRTKRPKINIATMDHIQQHWCGGCCSCCCPKNSDDQEEEEMKKNLRKNILDPADLMVDAIDYLNDQIAILNEEISIMQMEALKAEEDMKSESSKKYSSFNKNQPPNPEDLVELTSSKSETILGSNPMYLSQSIQEASTTLRESLKDYKNVDKMLLSAINDVSEKITKKMISGTGFVTFKSRRTQITALNIPFLAEDHPRMKATTAPPPSDIIWENMDASTDLTKRRAVLTSMFYFTGLVFWGVILAFIAAISQLSSLESVFPFLNDLDTAAYSILEGLLPVIIMMIFISLIPITMSFLAMYFERRKTHSQVQYEVFQWFYMYQIATVYFFLLAGSTLNSISDIVDNPGSVLIYLSAALPTTSIFFMNYCITTLFITVPLVSLQIMQLIYFLIIRWYYNEKEVTRRMVVKDILENVTMDYGTTLPDTLYILAIGLLYWVIAPLVIIIITFIFGATYILMKYQYLYIFTRKYESGGNYWYGLYNYSMIALMISTITMIVYLSIKEAYIQAPLLAPLPLIIYFFWNYTEDRFRAVSSNVPYSSALKVDLSEESKSRKDYESFNKDYLKQPSLIAKKVVQPYPYRVNALPLINEEGLVNPIYYEDNPLGDEEGGGNDEESVHSTTEGSTLIKSSSKNLGAVSGTSDGENFQSTHNPLYQQRQQQQQQGVSVKSGNQEKVKGVYAPPSYKSSDKK
jgi:uncharacterized small protein (DUF1192 family)